MGIEDLRRLLDDAKRKDGDAIDQLSKLLLREGWCPNVGCNQDCPAWETMPIPAELPMPVCRAIWRRHWYRL